MLLNKLFAMAMSLFLAGYTTYLSFLMWSTQNELGPRIAMMVTAWPLSLYTLYLALKLWRMPIPKKRKDP